MLRLFSPAKINLFLRVVAKRPDGYHDLSSLFQAITLGDTITIEFNDSHDQLLCTDSSLPTDQSNLVLKATDLFRKKTGIKHYFKIHLHKRIPLQAGLGGGSSNAATTLWGCNQLVNGDVPATQLKEWSAEIGSDIPFFFSNGTAYCTGRGEHVRSIPSLLPQKLWIVKPAEGLSTPEIFRRLNFQLDLPKLSWQNDLENFILGSMPHFNDLEQPAFEMLPELKELKALLMRSGFHSVVMTGAGSAFFCFGEKNPSQCLPSYLNIFPVHFINRSELNWYRYIN